MAAQQTKAVHGADEARGEAGMKKYIIVSNDRDQKTGDRLMFQFFARTKRGKVQAEKAAREAGINVLGVFSPSQRSMAYTLSLRRGSDAQL
ncbi:hypothetical protein ACWM9A_10750 [Acetobacter pasteurianus]